MRRIVLLMGLSLAACIGPPPVLVDGGSNSDSGVSMVDAGAVDSGTPDAGTDAGMLDAGMLDAGMVDAGIVDAGMADAGMVDAGMVDAGTPDAGTPDAGTPDAGPPDAGPPDAGPPDAGPPDAGPPDAGPPDAGPPDAGPPDAGRPDAGVPVQLGGVVIGLEPGTTVTLHNGSSTTNVSGSDGGVQAFSLMAIAGSAYEVKVATQPSNQLCVVNRGVGTAGLSTINNVLVGCSTSVELISQFPFDGTVDAGAGLSWDGLIGADQAVYTTNRFNQPDASLGASSTSSLDLRLLVDLRGRDDQPDSGFTVMAWVRMPDPQQPDPLISYETDALIVSMSKLRCGFADDGGTVFEHVLRTMQPSDSSVTSTTRVQANTWYHVALTAYGPDEGDGMVQELYVNGVREGRVVLDGGWESQSYYWALRDSLQDRDDLRLYGRRLSGQEISRVYVSEIAPYTAPPAAPPQPLITYGLKTITVSWPAVANATWYRVFEKNGMNVRAVSAEVYATSLDLYVPVHLADWLNVQWQVQACNALGCSASSALRGPTPAGLLKMIGLLESPFPDVNHHYGDALAMSADGRVIVVGDIGINSNRGAAQVYVYSDGKGWQSPLQLDPPIDAQSGPIFFGQAVAVDGTGQRIAVSSGAEPTGTGLVYLFTRTGSTWAYEQQVTNTTMNAEFGRSISLSGDGQTLAVGAHVNGAQNPGAVALFIYDGSTWTSAGPTVNALDAFSNDGFGASVALDEVGSTLVVGAPKLMNAPPGSIATAHVFRRSGNFWTTANSVLKVSAPDAGVALGSSVAVSGDGKTMAVTSGEATRVFREQLDGGWSTESSTALTTRTPNCRSVSLSGDGEWLAVGCPAESSLSLGVPPYTTGSAPQTGGVYLFQRSGGTWPQSRLVKPSNTEAEKFGSTVVLSQDAGTLSVGAADNNVGAGACYLY